MSSQTTVDIKRPLLRLAWFSALMGGGPLWPHLQRPVQVLLPLALLAGIWAERRGRVLLGGYWGTLVVVLVFLFYALQVRISYLVEPVVNMLALMLAVRLAGEKSARNLLQLYLLAIFSLAASTLISLEMSFIVYLLLLVTSVTISLVLLAYYTHDASLAVTRQELRTVLRWSLLLPAVSLVLMLFFFVILPRTESPLMHFLNPGGESSSGFNESVAPGSVAGNAGNPAVAFRAEGPEMDPNDLYWRGIVLNTVDESVWRRGGVPQERPGAIAARQQVTVRILPEGWRQRFLVTLDKPLEVERERLRVDPDLVYSFRRPPRHRFEYQVEAAISDLLPSPGPQDMSPYLRVGGGVDERVAALAARIRAEARENRARVEVLKEFFRAQGLAYSTQSIPVTDNPVGEFLFDSRTGYCEHFASAFATVLRLAGVPSRLVGGYYGGVYNELGGYTLVTESMAHVWVEAFIPGQGWLRVDPSQYAVNVASSLRDFSRHQIPFWRGAMDSLQHFWSRAVLNFYLEQQVETLQSMRRNVDGLRRQASWRETLPWLGGVLVLACGVWWWRRPRRSIEGRLVEGLRRSVARCYGEAWGDASRGLEELADGTGDPAVRAFAELYQGVVFRDGRLSREQQRRLRRLVGRVGRFRGVRSGSTGRRR